MAPALFVFQTELVAIFGALTHYLLLPADIVEHTDSFKPSVHLFAPSYLTTPV